MCGVPYHAAQGYIARLLKAGKRVAIAEQTSDPKPGKLVEREIARILSAGSDRRPQPARRPAPELPRRRLPPRENRRPRLRRPHHRRVHHRRVRRPRPARGRTRAHLPLRAAHPRPPDRRVRRARATAWPTTATPSCPSTPRSCSRTTSTSTRSTASAAPNLHAASGAAGAILHYLIHQLRRPCDHLRAPRGPRKRRPRPDRRRLAAQPRPRRIPHRQAAHPVRRARPHRHPDGRAPAARLDPPPAARSRHRCIARQDIIAALSRRTLPPLQMPRVAQRHPRHRAHHLPPLPRLRQRPRPPVPRHLPLPHPRPQGGPLLPLSNRQSAIINRSIDHSALHDFPDLTDPPRPPPSPTNRPPTSATAASSATAGPPNSTNSATPRRGGKDWIARLQEDERKRTGIDSLKIKFNNVFGYFIEITTAAPRQGPRRLHAQADHGQRRALHHPRAQGDGEQGARRRGTLQEARRRTLRSNSATQVVTHLAALQETAAAIAEIDVLCALAEVAQLHRHCRPVLNESRLLRITNGRHPVLEQTLADEKFVPNDTALDPDDRPPADPHRPQHGRQIHLHPPDRPDHRDGPDRRLRPRRVRHASASSTASSAASAPPTTSRAASPPSWSR